MRIVQQIGNTELWQRKKTLFLCSKRTPFSWYATVFAWVESLSAADCVMCVNTTEFEAEVLKALLVQGVPTVLVVMQRFRLTNDVQVMNALSQGRMLVVVLERDEPRGRGQTPRLRNEFLLAAAAHIVCGYVNKNGSVFPIVAVRPETTFLQPLPETMVADEAPRRRWSLWEDKTLLRMFYDDLGLHAIHKETKRPYTSVRARIRALTMPEDVLKGREFEEWVLDLFNRSESPSFVLKEWRGDKMMDDVCPEGNRYPDFIFEKVVAKGSARDRSSAVPDATPSGSSSKPVALPASLHAPLRFAVECKWRARVPLDIEADLFRHDRLAVFHRFFEERKIPIYILLGVGGEPSDPEALYVIPFEAVPPLVSGQLSLASFRRRVPKF